MNQNIYPMLSQDTISLTLSYKPTLGKYLLSVKVTSGQNTNERWLLFDDNTPNLILELFFTIKEQLISNGRTN